MVFDLRMLIDTINQERATPKSTEECRQKLLMILASRPELNKEVTAELVHASLPCRVGGVPGGAPDYLLTADYLCIYYQTLWKGFYDQVPLPAELKG